MAATKVTQHERLPFMLKKLASAYTEAASAVLISKIAGANLFILEVWLHKLCRVETSMAVAIFFWLWSICDSHIATSLSGDLLEIFLRFVHD